MSKTILYATDLHYYGSSPPHYQKSVVAVPLFFQELARLQNRLDLLVLGGDCVNAGSARIQELEGLKRELHATGVPYRAVAGNHDIAPSKRYARMYPGMEDWEDVALTKTNFGRVFGEPAIRGIEFVEGVPLILFSVRNGDPDGQLDWLADTLQGPGPALVVGHFPVLTTRTGGFCEGWGYSRIDTIRSRLARILSDRTDTTVYLCGHQHINAVARRGALVQVSTGAVGAATCCYRLLTVDSGRLNISTHTLPSISDWLGDAMNPDRSTDEAHPDLVSYHWGTEQERELEIRLGN
jgi:predicted phosphodiesterase